MLLSRETSGPNSSVKTALRDSRLTGRQGFPQTRPSTMILPSKTSNFHRVEQVSPPIFDIGIPFLPIYFIFSLPSCPDIIEMCSSGQGGRVGSRKSICRKGEPVYLNESYPRVPWKPTAILKSNSPCNNPAPPPTVNFYDCQNDRRRTHFSNV